MMASQSSQQAFLDSPKRMRPTRILTFGRLQDWFLIAAVATILETRLQLKLTNYPKLGGSSLHIGHVLWGGLAMLVAILVLLTVLDRRWRLPAAIVGGVGFGLFIDEVGKFVTHNNDYFFKPTAAIIYIGFICLYLVTRWYRQHSGFRPSEYVANALDVFSDAAGPSFTEREKRQTLELLDRAGDNRLAASLHGLVQGTPAIPAGAPGRLERIGATMRRRYAQLTNARWFSTAVIAVFVIAGTLNAVQLVLIVLWLFGLDLPLNWNFSFAQAGQAISGLAELVLIYVGIARLIAHRRLDAYRMFEYALLIELFLGQMFAYIDQSFVATWGLVITVVLLVSVRIAMRQEMELAQSRGSQDSGSVVSRKQAPQGPGTLHPRMRPP